MSVRHAILGLLQNESRHGYELRTAFQALVGDSLNWELKPAQVYTTLGRLEDAGLVRCTGVEQSGGPEKRIYELTDEGRAELSAWLTEGVSAEHVRDPFFIKLMVAQVTDTDPRPLIVVQRAVLYRELHELTRRRASLDPKTSLAQALLYDKAVMHLDADLRWLDMIEARLEEVERQPIGRPETRRRGRPPKGTPGEEGADERGP